jgi:hypothetical protein
MKTLGRLLQNLDNRDIGAALAKVDYIGVGRGVVDRAKEQNRPVHPISVGESSTVMSCLLCKYEWDKYLSPTEHCPNCSNSENALIKPVFANLLSQLWWNVRGLFERGEIDIASEEEDSDLAAELLMVRWEPNSKGQTVVKYADGPSPNRADALMITFAPLPLGIDADSWVCW